MKKNSIGVITSGFLPVPATKGGAVENLLVNVMNENEIHNKIKLTIFSVYDNKADRESKKYKNTEFVFFKTGIVSKSIDKIIYFFAKNILKKKNSHSYRYICQRLDYLRQVSKEINKNDYKEILLENHPTQYLALKWKKNYLKYAGRYSYHCHNEFQGLYGCEEIILNTKQFICVSDYIKNTLSEYLKIEKTRFVVLRNCIDENKFNLIINDDERNKIRKKYGFGPNDFVFLFTGRVVPEKGVLELIKAAKNTVNKDFKILIVGSSLNAVKSKSKYEESVKNELEDVKDKIIFTGFVEYELIPQLYNISDVAIIPSVWNDPAPLTIIESLTVGLPIITTNSGGICEYVDNKAAIILERDEKLVENISKSIDVFLNDKDIMKKMARESKKLSKELTRKNYFDNFRRLIDKKVV